MATPNATFGQDAEKEHNLSTACFLFSCISEIKRQTSTPSLFITRSLPTRAVTRSSVVLSFAQDEQRKREEEEGGNGGRGGGEQDEDQRKKKEDRKFAVSASGIVNTKSIGVLLILEAWTWIMKLIIHG